MTDGLPSAWECTDDRTYMPRAGARERRFRLYEHESEDLRLRVGPPEETESEYPGYLLVAIPYPSLDRDTHDLELPERLRVASAFRFDQCVADAHRFMKLFNGVYDGAGTLTPALEYALPRTGTHSQVEIDVPETLEDPGTD